jgi:hypothetical protein
MESDKCGSNGPVLTITACINNREIYSWVNAILQEQVIEQLVKN